MNHHPIITFTKAAAEHIQQLVKDKEGFRLSVKKTGCSGLMYEPDIVETMNPDDLTWETEFGFKVFIDRDCIPMIQGTQLDFERQEMGQSRLRFHNPNVDQACGCGDSFNLKEKE